MESAASSVSRSENLAVPETCTARSRFPSAARQPKGEKSDAGGERGRDHARTARADEDSEDRSTSPRLDDGQISQKEEAAVATAPDETGTGPGAAVGEDESRYVKGAQLLALSAGLCLAMFVVALDNTIIATAIPQITTKFNSLDDVAWYGSSYLLTNCALQPTFGKIYTYFNVKWTSLVALLIFELGSIVCAAATGSPMLIVGRAVAGAGAAAIFSGGIIIIGYSVPLRKRAIFVASMASMFGIASVVGPLLGGVFTDRLTWRWCFWINLPFGGVALLTVFCLFKNPERERNHLSIKEKIFHLDLLGGVFLISAVVCLLLALQWGGIVYSWGESKVWGCLLGFGLLISIFIGTQFWMGDRGTIPPRIVRQRTVWASCCVCGILGLGLFVHIYYLPFYFQAIKDTSAEGSGIRTIPLLVTITCASVFSGGLITAFGIYTPFMWVGTCIFTVGAGLLHTLAVHSRAGKWIGYQLLTGVGAGLSIQVPFISVQVVLSSKDQPTGNSLVVFVYSLGGAISIAIVQNIFVNALIEKLSDRVPGIDPHIIVNAYNYALMKSFIVAIAAGGVAFIASLFVEMKSVKTKEGGIKMGGM